MRAAEQIAIMVVYFGMGMVWAPKDRGRAIVLGLGIYLVGIVWWALFGGL